MSSNFLLTFLRNGNQYQTVVVSRSDGEADIVEAVRQLHEKYRTPINPFLWVAITDEQAEAYKKFDEGLCSTD